MFPLLHLNDAQLAKVVSLTDSLVDFVSYRKVAEPAHPIGIQV
jgi:hypothetical protein